MIDTQDEGNSWNKQNKEKIIRGLEFCIHPIFLIIFVLIDKHYFCFLLDYFTHKFQIWRKL